jgi:hypothetical protein
MTIIAHRAIFGAEEATFSGVADIVAANRRFFWFVAIYNEKNTEKQSA